MNLLRTTFKLLVSIAFLGVCFACGAERPSSDLDPSAAANIPDTIIPAALILPTWMPTDSTGRYEVLTGRFDPTEDSNFVTLESRYTDGDGTYLLRRETAEAVRKMIDSARADGIKLRVRSATRNFNRQKQIWEAKWTGQRTLSNGVNLAKANMSDSAKARMILLYSSMPGTSRHHWGTDIDFNAFENSYFESGKGKEEYNWLQEHAASFGFYQPYTSKTNGRMGYEEERWHWSYQPISGILTQLYKDNLTINEISGFKGAEQAQNVNAIREYVLGINPEMLK